VTIRFSRLTRPAIRQLKPGQKLGEHGIIATKLADGDARYSVNIMVDGRRIHRVIGAESAGVTRHQAEQFIEQARSDARAGRLSLPKGRKLALTFADAADTYIERLEEAGGKNLRVKHRHLGMYLKPYFGAMRLDSITGFTIEKYKKRRRDRGAAAATVNRELATLSHLLNSAVEWKWLDRVPARAQKLAEGGGRIIAMTDEQCDALMNAAIAGATPDLWLFVAFGLNTAMRHSEILAARWDQLAANRRLFVPDAKTGQREQPITPELAVILAGESEMREDREGWIFPSPHADSGTGHLARMDRPFREAVKAAGLDPELITPHVMRHTAITKLVQAGVDLPTIQKISGHKTLAMVLRYTHVHGQHIDEAIRSIGRSLPELQENETSRTITQELHTPSRGASVAKLAKKPKTA
jgi:integrase